MKIWTVVHEWSSILINKNISFLTLFRFCNFKCISKAYSALHVATFWRLDVLDCCCAVNWHSEIDFFFQNFTKQCALSVIETEVTTENASSQDRFGFGGNYESE